MSLSWLDYYSKNSSTETNNMEFVSSSHTTRSQNAANTTVYEYPTTDPSINGAVATIFGRYPEKGFVLNSICKEIVYVIEGNGIIGLIDKEVAIKNGDVLLLQPNEKYYWDGNLTLFMVTAPKFDPTQHKLVS